MVDASSSLPFDRATQWTSVSSTRFTGHIGQQWLQGRGAFGGVVAGAAVEAMAPMVAKARPLRQIDLRFMAPVAPDEAVDLEVEVLRESKRISHLRATFTQDGATACIVGATFATPRPSERALAPPQRPIGVPAPEDLPDMPFLPGLIPAASELAAVTPSHGPALHQSAMVSSFSASASTSARARSAALP